MFCIVFKHVRVPALGQGLMGYVQMQRMLCKDSQEPGAPAVSRKRNLVAMENKDRVFSRIIFLLLNHVNV